MRDGDLGNAARRAGVRRYPSAGPDARPHRIIGVLLLVLAVTAAALLIGLAYSGVLGNRHLGEAQAATPQSASPMHGPLALLRVYFVSGEQLAPVSRDVSATEDALTQALQALLSGPSAGERAQAIESAIPSGAQLQSAAVSGSTAVLSFDARFAQALAGAGRSAGQQATNYRARLAEVTFTATAVAGVQGVQISAPGRRTVFLTRADFGPRASVAPVRRAPRKPSLKQRRALREARIHPMKAIQVQAALVRLKYLPLSAATGVFDYRTSQAVMAFQSWEGLQRDGDPGKQTVPRLRKALPPVPTHHGSGRWVEVHRAKGTLLLVQDGVLVQAVHCSTGRTMDAQPYGTPPGAYKVYAKMLKAWSEPYKVWMPYAAYFDGGIAMHGLDSVPPYPASHGCVRISMPEAPTVYAFVSLGTPVYVY